MRLGGPQELGVANYSYIPHTPCPMNRLLFGDNLQWLRDVKLFPDASVDLVYLDPPFNSNADYNVLFREASGEASLAQFHAFTDTWNWADAAQTYAEFVDHCPNTAVVEMVEALHSFLKNSPMMAYLAMMAPRLVELHRVLKPTGSLYLHCDATASHYLRLLLDGVFGTQNFKNEIIWSYRRWPSIAKNFQRMHDAIFFYSKSQDAGRPFHVEYEPNSDSYTKRFKGNTQILDPECKTRKIPVDEPSRGLARRDVWELSILAGSSNERLGYPTQKPQALLERIIEASTNKGDLVLDPFCGCGTTIHAAHKLGRQWIGIDVTYLAINLIKRRLKDAFGDEAKFQEHGQPTDFPSAKRLAELDKWQFQQWALSLIDARPRTEGEGKGADRGVDGMLYFYEGKEKREKILVQVKGGGVKRNDISTLLGDVNNQKFAAGILVTLEKPSKPMRAEATDAGRYESKLWHDKNYPKIQILTIEGILSGQERVEAPPQINPFAKAALENKSPKQPGLI